MKWMHSSELLEFDHNSKDLKLEILRGLFKHQKMMHSKFLYDKKGSEIFEEICKLPEYYPTRTETAILKEFAMEMAEVIGHGALIIEPGSGNGIKVRFLIEHLKELYGYVPIEISKEILIRMTNEFHRLYPDLDVFPVCTDFTKPFELPLQVEAWTGKRIIFFPGSTIGNFQPNEVVDFLNAYGRLLPSGGGMLIGVDLKKDKNILELAYDDPAGITAAFNLNLLERLNREASASFEISNFSHLAVYNEKYGRVEMHLKSEVNQTVKVFNASVNFRRGETIHTESSYKYSMEEFSELCSKAKLKLKKFWMDHKKFFCVYYFEKE